MYARWEEALTPHTKGKSEECTEAISKQLKMKVKNAESVEFFSTILRHHGKVFGIVDRAVETLSAPK